MRSDTLIVVPMKDPARAKTRLRGVLGPRETARLARHLFDRTLGLLLDLRAADPMPVFDLAVVTGHGGIAQVATDLGLLVIEERADATLSQAIDDAARAAVSAGYRRLCILPADLAVPDPADVRRLVTHPLPARGLALCPSNDYGTNALIAAPPDVIAFAYGPKSFHAHRAAAEARGLTPEVLPLESLRWDIDSSADLAELRQVAPEALNFEASS